MASRRFGIAPFSLQANSCLRYSQGQSSNSAANVWGDLARSSTRFSLAFALRIGLATALTLPGTPHAQNIAPRPAGPRTLTGIVTDTLGTPIADVDVLVIKLQRRMRTRGDGTFKFDSIPPGTYDLRARGIGLIAPSPTVVVGPNGGAVRIRMIRLGTILPAMVTTAKLGGLSGVIGDTSYRAMPGVTVTVLGTGQAVQTDSTGSFFVPLRPGQYMLRIERDGFARQMVGVSVPENEGRRVAAWLVPQSGPANHVEAQQLFDLDQRLMRVSMASSKFFSREDLEKQGLADLHALALRWANGIVTAECEVSLNGGPRTVPLGRLSSSEVEFVEVYLPSKTEAGAQTRGVTSIGGHQTKFTTSLAVRPSVKPSCGNLALVAWLRQ